MCENLYATTCYLQHRPQQQNLVKIRNKDTTDYHRTHTIMSAAIKPPVQPRKKSVKLLTCHKCNENFDDGRHQAKCLPCLHTYCKSCLMRHSGRRQKFNCPGCNKEVVLPGGTIDSLPNNFLVQNMKGHQDIFKDKIACGNCQEEGNQAMSFCHDCSCFQCQTCVDNHHKMKALNHHKLSTIKDLQEKSYNPLMQNHCQKHPMQTLTLYCRNRECRSAACASCGHTNHRGHDLIDLTAAADEIRADVRILSSQVNKKSQKMARMRTILEKAEKTLLDTFNQKQRDMYESVQQVYSLIDSRYNDAQANLKQLFQTENDRLTGNFKTIDSLTAQMSSACEFAEDACDMGHPTQLLAAQTQILDRLRELEQTPVPENAAHNADLQFTAKHHSALTQIQELLQHLYDVDGPQPGPSTKGKGNLRKPPAPGPSPPSPLLPQRVPQADPTKCSIQLKKQSERKWCYRGIIQAVDFSGKPIKGGGAAIDARLDDGKVLIVNDSKDGTYWFDYEDNAYGNSIHVKINSTTMVGSPFKG
ncbi:E3 ubiquitin-protein ligase TRIM56-like [Amphiura filiformis]|uniref:E3 ubiquitin-protein ligase TRIM56-like n=1 Tax=Amphiura filiformis TaxID=82378 RepID=UPI003B223734